jgi:ParB family transcriptional regulator, chromosome partitioning protein
MKKETTEAIENVPVNRVRIANPRPRNRATWREIVSSIRAVGLKKPITVSRRRQPDPDGNEYDLVCGQGRLEAFREIGLETIPAIITDASEPDQYLMSLIENIARRPSSNKSLYFEVKRLLHKGYDDSTIARKLGIDRSYTRGIVRLVENDEPRLIAAVESGSLPVTVAIQIATGEDEAAQTALMQAYESGELRGTKLKTVRALINKRKNEQDGRGRSKRPLTGPALANLYRQRVREQQRLVAKADHAKERLLIIATVMRTLFEDENFRTLLRAESLSDMPEQLAAAIR